MDYEKAHEIGRQLADAITKEQHEYVLTTHIDRGHIHNHIIFCAVNFVEHHKYISNRRSYYGIRNMSDKLCQENGLSVVVPGKGSKGKSYAEYQAEKTGTSWKGKLKIAVVAIVPQVSSFEELLSRLRTRAAKAPGRQKNGINLLIDIQHEQENRERAYYGKQTLKQLSKELTAEFGKGFSRSNLQNMRAFYLAYPICQTVSGKLSWSHYCELLSISVPDKRSFYEKEAVNSGWSIRELKRQISTSLYEQLLLSEGKTNKETVLALAEKGIEMTTPSA